MSDNFQHILMLVVVLAVGAAFYYLSTNDTLFTGSHTRAQEIATRTEEARRDMIVPLERLRSVELDMQVFESKEYATLQEKSAETRTPELERQDPFSPVR